MSNARRSWVSIIGLCVIVSVFTATRAEARTITLTFPDLDELFVAFLGSEDLDFVITNSTGVAWTDFHLESQGIGAFTTNYSGPGTATYTDPFIAAPFGVEISFGLDIVGLNIAPGETLQFSQSTYCFGEACALGGIIAAQPTTDARPPDEEEPPVNGVPEPSSLVLLGAALGAMGMPRKRRE